MSNIKSVKERVQEAHPDKDVSDELEWVFEYSCATGDEISELCDRIEQLENELTDTRKANLESQNFYEVMQSYRHDKGTGSGTFEAVKEWLRNPIYNYQQHQREASDEI